MERDEPPSSAIEITVLTGEHDAAVERRELQRSLESHPRRIPSRYFYDDVGSRLFDEITRLPEYYLTRAETEILQRQAARIVEAAGAMELVELGSGTATKTRILLDAMAAAGTLRRYVPFDVSEPVVRATAGDLVEAYPGLAVHGVVGEFDLHLAKLPAGERRLVLLLGSTIGNFDLTQAAALLSRVAEPMDPGDRFLLGADLVKDVGQLEAAYNDSRGVTAEFNLNILEVVNRAFGGDFRRDLFRHRAFFDRRNEWIEMRLVSQERQAVRLTELEIEVVLEDGEEIRTEISSKYRREAVDDLLRRAGFELESWMTDSAERFALALARRL